MSTTRTMLVLLFAAAAHGCGDEEAPPDNASPLADFSAPAEARVGQQVVVDGSASRDPDGHVRLYAFDWGDAGPEEIGPSPVGRHTYREPGLYTATLSAIDERGAKSSVLHNIVISP